MLRMGQLFGRKAPSRHCLYSDVAKILLLVGVFRVRGPERRVSKPGVLQQAGWCKGVRCACACACARGGKGVVCEQKVRGRSGEAG